MSSGTAFGTLGDPPGPLKTYVFLKEFNDFHYCGNPGFSLVSAAHPRGLGLPRVPREHPFSAPVPSPLEYFTRLFLAYTVLLGPFFLAPPHAGPGVGGFERPAATCADPGREMGPQLSRREGTHRPRKAANVQAVCECVRDCPGPSGCFIFWDLSKFSNPKICARHSSTPKHRYRDNLDAGGPIFDQKWSPE